MENHDKVSNNSKLTIVPLDEKWFKQARVSEAAKEHLLSSMRNLESGRDATPSFGLYGQKSEDVDDTHAKRFLDSIRKKYHDLPKGLLEYEESRLSKWGPQGGYKDWDNTLKPLFELYQTRLRDCLVAPETRKVWIQKFMRLNLQMLAISNTLAKLIADDKIMDRAAGCRDFNLKKTDPIAQKHAIEDLRSGLSKEFFGYVFSRFNKQKPRIFMPMPFSLMIDQERYFLPFLEAIKRDISYKGKNSDFVSYSDKMGFDTCFKLMEEEIDSCSPQEGSLLYVQGDFEKMDTTTGPSQYDNLVIPAFAEAFHFSDKSQNFRNMWDTFMATCTTPIASPSGMMVGDHGTASGATLTNIGETVCNDYYGERKEYHLCRLCKEAGITYKLVAKRYNGDDSTFVYWLEDPNRMEEFKTLVQRAAELAADECGFRINDKWKMSTDHGLFCQNFYYYNYKTKKVIWMYPSVLIMNSIQNPEHEYSPDEWDKDYRDLDIIPKLDNGHNLPYYEDLVNYVDNGMRYRLLGRTQKATHRILSKWDKYRAQQSLHEYFNHQDYDISHSPTINLILKKRSRTHAST